MYGFYGKRKLVPKLSLAQLDVPYKIFPLALLLFYGSL